MFAVCSVPIAPMRKEPSHRSEMVSQLLFGEFVNLLLEEKDFIQVKCLYDGYEGWCQRNQLTEVEASDILDTTGFTGNFLNEVLMDNTIVSIPFASPVYDCGQSAIQWGSVTVDYGRTKQTMKTQGAFSKELLNTLAYRYLNTAYLWGGKSIFGIDCSGFSQQVFKLLGIPLLRDASLQATQGKAVAALFDAETGDLAFFANEEGRITHVGIIVSKTEIIHASGSVRVDMITGEGIIKKDGKRTHNLHSIRRYSK